MSSWGQGRGPGWNRTRQHILIRDHHTCYRCGNHATEVDHVTPRSQGGPTTPSNLAAICIPCHRAKTQREAQAGYRRWRDQRPKRQRPAESHPGLIEPRGGG